MSIARTLLLLLSFAAVTQMRPALSAPSGASRIPPSISGYRMADLRGALHTLRGYRGHAVVLNIWAAWCPPCRTETPRLERAYEAYRKQGVVVVGVDQGDSAAHVSAFVKRFGLRYPVLLDPKERFGAAAGFNFPTTVFVDGAGRVRSVHRGEITAAQLQRRIRSLLQ